MKSGYKDITYPILTFLVILLIKVFLLITIAMIFLLLTKHITYELAKKLT